VAEVEELMLMLQLLVLAPPLLLALLGIEQSVRILQVGY
jgi:hypothetical protein